MGAALLTLLLAACGDGGGANHDTDAGTDAGADGGADEECTDDVWVDTFDEAECPEMSGWDDCVVYVRTDGSPSGDGKTWATATNDIQDAVNTARCGVIGTDLCAVWQVWIAEGTYYVFEKCNSDTIYLRTDVALYGGFAGDETEREQRDPAANETILSGADGPTEGHNAITVITASAVDGAILDGLTVTGALSDDYEGGGLWASDSEILIHDCQFTGNHANMGGGLYALTSSLSVSGSDFSANTAVEAGGGLILDDTTASFESCTFDGNTVLGEESIGGAIDCENSSIMSILESTFSGNSADAGGAISNFSTFVDIDTCEFIGNYAPAGGGAIHAGESSTSIVNSVFQNNETVGIAGAIFFRNDEIGLVDGSTFTGNLSSGATPPNGWAGGVGVNTGNVTIQGSSFDGNESAHYGGAISIYDATSGTVTGCTFTENLSEKGGAVLVWLTDSFETTDNVYSDNVAELGGGLWVQGSPSSTISNNVFARNMATSGGGMYVNDGSPAVASCTFQGNSASEGGAAYVRDSALELADSILWDNGDAGVTLYDDATATVTYSDVEGGWDGGVGNIDADPLFVDAAGGDFHLQSGSPCIDAANGDLAPEFDIEGFSRWDDPGVVNTGIGTPDYVDMGAYEWQV